MTHKDKEKKHKRCMKAKNESKINTELCYQTKYYNNNIVVMIIKCICDFLQAVYYFSYNH